MWRRNRISPDTSHTTKGRFIWINGCFQRNFILFVRVLEEIYNYANSWDATKTKVRECWMDRPYRIFGSGSAALASPSLPCLDSKALRSESDIFATNSKGSCGVDPGTISLILITLSASFHGWLVVWYKEGSWKRLVLSPSLISSTVAMLHFTFFGDVSGRHRSSFDAP